MSKPVRLDSLAEQEAEEADLWYEKRGPAMGSEEQEGRRVSEIHTRTARAEFTHRFC